ncbi:MAG: helix-turn-helix domain-containing protein [Chloroflexi bacterium]|nr:helix-turn-helix domain-containing protein [Chloroflexota bacterium]
MSDLAQRIRTAREKLGASIDEAERATKIRRRYIEAIEAGDFSRLPDGPPSRGYVKIYARYLGLDPDQALTDFEAEVGVPITQVNEVVPPPPTRQPAVSRYTQLVKLPQVRWRGELPPADEAELDMMADDDSARSGMSNGANNSLGRLVFRRTETPAVPNSFSLREPKVTQASDVRPFQLGRSPFSLRTPQGALGDVVGEPTRLSPMSAYAPARLRKLIVAAMAAGGLVLVMVVVGLVILPALRGNADQSGTVPSPTQVISVSILATDQPSTTAALAAGVINAAATNDTSALTAPESTPVPGVAPEPTAEATVPAVQPLAEGGVQLMLDARERAWVRVKVDGNIVYEGIPAIGPSALWQAQNTVGIETGNAGAFDIIINGTRLGAAGTRNATVHVTWDATGKVIEN